MDVRFAGDEADLAALMEQGLIRGAQLEMLQGMAFARERERMREVMRLRSDKLAGSSPAQLIGEWVSGAEGVEGYA